MAQVDYDLVMPHVYEDEGGYGWDRGDSGGPTKYGITCYDLAEHRGLPMHSMTQWAPLVQAMDKSEAESIYEVKYNKGVRFDELNPGKDYAILDYGINSGVSRPIRVAQTMLKLPSTGKLDDITLHTINSSDHDWFINGMQDERLHFMHAIKGGEDWKLFGRGWGRRVESVRTISLSLAKGSINLPPPSTTTTNLEPKTPLPKVKHQPDPNIKKKIIIGGATGTAGAGGAIHTWAPMGINLDILIAIGSIAIIGGVIYYLWHQHSVDKANQTVVLPPSVIPRGPII